MKFSTKDQDNDMGPAYDCANTFKGGWWYYHCYRCNLNGQYVQLPAGNRPFTNGIVWVSFKGHAWAMKFVEMKIRPYE